MYGGGVMPAGGLGHCQEPKTGQQKVQLEYKDDPLCPACYIIYLWSLLGWEGSAEEEDGGSEPNQTRVRHGATAGQAQREAQVPVNQQPLQHSGRQDVEWKSLFEGHRNNSALIFKDSFRMVLFPPFENDSIQNPISENGTRLYKKACLQNQMRIYKHLVFL